ncbi:coiled-coil domain-containing protein 169 [Austrofundulus limnaeus]|uniref:Coiled-coil domain-containing protein 169 n=1 Tax=Austrofundulus limnaeus TaxID=52670 RepID=A0A2I4ATB9_AUSLI|nr:PREDICTED: coiled-coil domain-containing protein 169 [Austrofundulus limnaeus]
MMAKEDSRFDLSRLRAELEEEKEMKEMLEESVCDLRRTIKELQERLFSVDEQGNEWKTRYETQVELNGHLDRQISHIQDRLEDMRGNPTDRLAFIRSYDDMAVETLKQHLKLLTEKRSDLQSQLMDCHLQIEHEGKAFHRANDERRAYLTEIAKLSSAQETQRSQYSTQRQRAPGSKPIRGKQIRRKTQLGSNKEGEEAEDVNGGGGDSTTERKSQKKNRLPTRITKETNPD